MPTTGHQITKEKSDGCYRQAREEDRRKEGHEGAREEGCCCRETGREEDRREEARCQGSGQEGRRQELGENRDRGQEARRQGYRREESHGSEKGCCQEACREAGGEVCRQEGQVRRFQRGSSEATFW